MTHADAQVEFVHMHATEFEGQEIRDGALEIVQEEDGRFLVQISSGDICARAWVSKEDMREIVQGPPITLR